MDYTPEELATKSEDYCCGLLSAAEYRQYLTLCAANMQEEHLELIAGLLSPDNFPDIPGEDN